MKKGKRIVAMIMAGLLAGALMTGCSSNTEAPTETAPATDVAEADQETTETEEAQTPETEEAEVEEAEDVEAGETEMANPWKDCTEAEAKEACPRLFKAPEGAMVNGWSMMEPANSEGGVPGPLVQMDFRNEGVTFCARAQYGAAENEDISGANYEWTTTEDVTLANWGEGNMPAKYSRCMDEGWTVDLLTWYDIEIGIAYSLTAEAADLEGFDLQAIAEQMFDGENDPTDSIPDDENAENPVAEYAGQYYIGKGNLSISPEGTDGALIEVWWGSSAAEHSEWVMHGTFDESTMTITYSDCEKHDFTLNEDGEVEKDETAYTDGTGSVKINDNGSVTWTDDQDHIADDLEMTK
ncbi:MAG: hypothetical protein IK078_07415 [Lachnospiraceae bacterium]|nr:hypothetical protein [Lachnospiraceae bacterium]